MTSSSARQRPRPTAVRILRWLGFACLGVALLLMIAVAALQTAAGRRFALSRVAALLASQQIDFNADELRYNLLDLSLELRDVTIKSARRADLPPFAVIKHVTADLSLPDLIRGRYVVESGAVEGARVLYLADENGDNLPRPPSDPNKPGRELDYLIEDLKISDAEVRYENRLQRVDATLPVELLTITGHRVTNRHDIALVAANGRVRAQGRELQLARLTAALDLGKDDVEISRAALDAEGSQLEVSGRIARFSEPVLDARLQAVLDAARAAQLAGLEDRVVGRVSVTATAKGPATAPMLDARVEGRELAFRTIEALSLDAEVGYDGQTRQVTARSVEATAPWGHLTGSGLVSLERGSSQAAVRASGIDLPTLMRGLGLNQVVASRMDATADLTWPALEYTAASGTGDLTLRATRAGASRSTLPAAGRVLIRGDGSRLVALLKQLTAAGTTVNGQVTLVDGSFHAVDSSELAFRTAGRIADHLWRTTSHVDLFELSSSHERQETAVR